MEYASTMCHCPAMLSGTMNESFARMNGMKTSAGPGAIYVIENPTFNRSA